MIFHAQVIDNPPGSGKTGHKIRTISPALIGAGVISLDGDLYAVLNDGALVCVCENPIPVERRYWCQSKNLLRNLLVR